MQVGCVQLDLATEGRTTSWSNPDGTPITAIQAHVAQWQEAPRLGRGQYPFESDREYFPSPLDSGGEKGEPYRVTVVVHAFLGSVLGNGHYSYPVRFPTCSRSLMAKAVDLSSTKCWFESNREYDSKST